ncbi:amidohydrolase [Ensifer sp. 4252]|uniref:amidohydrolase n=1 Tax=Ensifer sp. 4252 TaxID=3373915 RepID=UPI003D24642F
MWKGVVLVINRIINDFVDRKSAEACALSDKVWDTPEVNFEEVRSSEAHLELLKREEFSFQTGIAGIPTAFIAEAGDSGPVIAILGEYDALPGLSQLAGVAEKREATEGGNGHGCGHNILGAGSLLAAIAVKDYLASKGISGRVRYYGCPAEEGGSAKGFMVRAGLFDDVDASLCWHPAAFTGVNRPFSLACAELQYSFTGRASHASIAPQLGRSALDALELMHIGINYLREHMSSTARVHYAITDAGGPAPNVVQAFAQNRLLVRSSSLGEMWDLVGRVNEIAGGAAMMTGTSVERRQISGDANLVASPVLERAMHEILEALGGPDFDDADESFAAEIQKTFSNKDVAASYGRFGLIQTKEEALSRSIYPLGSGSDHAVGSTDVGSVSWAVPTVQCRVASYAIGTPGHSWQLVAQGKASAAHKGLRLAAKAMASVAARLIEDEAMLEQANAEHLAFRANNPFVNPLGPEVMPALPRALD